MSSCSDIYGKTGDVSSCLKIIMPNSKGCGWHLRSRHSEGAGMCSQLEKPLLEPWSLHDFG